MCPDFELSLISSEPPVEPRLESLLKSQILFVALHTLPGPFVGLITRGENTLHPNLIITFVIESQQAI